MRNVMASACAALVLLGSAAQAQQSLFSQTPANPSTGFAPAPAAPAAAPPSYNAAPRAAAAPVAAEPAVDEAPVAAAPRPRPKPKPKGPQPARAVTVINASTGTVTGLVITAGEKTVTWAKPIGSQAKAVVKLPVIKGCTISVLATFAGEGAGNPGEVDICKDKTIRLTD
jgi:hypothetical protein